MNEPVIHDQHHPVSASAGGDNAYYLKGCTTVQRSPSYASCLFKVTEVEAGRITDYNRECSESISNKSCLAVGMREQERLQGIAMFYFPRNSPLKQFLPVDVAGDFGVRITNLTDPALIPKESKRTTPFKTAKPVSVVDAIDAEENIYAAAINESLKTASFGSASAGPEPGKTPADQKIKSLPLPNFTDAKPALKTNSRPPIIPGETPLQYARRIAQLTT